MKKILTVLFIGITQIGIAQTYDEDVIMKACSCIYNSQNDSIDSVVKNCLMKALLHSLSEDGISKKAILQEQTNMEDIENQTTFGEYLEMLYKNCSATSYLIDKKQNRYYKMSDFEDANIYYNKGVDFENREKPDSAIISYNKALTYDSLFVQALDHIGLLYGNMGEPDKAIQYSKKSLDIFPEGYTALLNLGAAYLTKEDYPEAFSSYVKIVKYYPESPEGYFGLGLVSFADNDYTTTARLMKHAHLLYSVKQSDHIYDCNEYLKASYYYLKEKGNDSLFVEIAEEFIPPIYQSENFNRLENFELKNEIDSRLMEPQIIICSDYILSTPAGNLDQNRTLAINIVKKWMSKTPDYIFNVDKNVAKILDKEGNVLSVFVAAMTKFAIENPEQGNNHKAVALYAWNVVLDYAANKTNNLKLTGEIKKMIKAKNSGTLEKQLGY